MLLLHLLFSFIIYCYDCSNRCPVVLPPGQRGRGAQENHQRSRAGVRARGAHRALVRACVHGGKLTEYQNIGVFVCVCVCVCVCAEAPAYYLSNYIYIYIYIMHCMHILHVKRYYLMHVYCMCVCVLGSLQEYSGSCPELKGGYVGVLTK